MLCEDLDRSLCGDVLFTGFIPTPHIPQNSTSNSAHSSSNNGSLSSKSVATSNDFVSQNKNASKPGNVLRLSNNSIPTTDLTSKIVIQMNIFKVFN